MWLEVGRVEPPATANKISYKIIDISYVLYDL